MLPGWWICLNHRDRWCKIAIGMFPYDATIICPPPGGWSGWTRGDHVANLGGRRAPEQGMMEMGEGQKARELWPGSQGSSDGEVGEENGAAVSVEVQGEGSEEAGVWGEEAVKRAVSVLGCDQNLEWSLSNRGGLIPGGLGKKSYYHIKIHTLQFSKKV